MEYIGQYETYIRNSEVIVMWYYKMSIVSGVIIGAFFSGNFEYIALHANQTYMLWWYPIIVCMYMIFAEEIIRICAWNYSV